MGVIAMFKHNADGNMEAVDGGLHMLLRRESDRFTLTVTLRDEEPVAFDLEEDFLAGRPDDFRLQCKRMTFTVELLLVLNVVHHHHTQVVEAMAAAFNH